MTTLLHKLRSASQITFRDWLLFLQAWCWLLFFDLALRTRPFPGLQSYAARSGSRRLPVVGQPVTIIPDLILAVDRARCHHIYRMTCLRRALALQKMLAQRGLVSELKIGVRKASGLLSAHAWLEYQGQPLGEPERITEHYAALKKA